MSTSLVPHGALHDDPTWWRAAGGFLGFEFDSTLGYPGEGPSTRAEERRQAVRAQSEAAVAAHLRAQLIAVGFALDEAPDAEPPQPPSDDRESDGDEAYLAVLGADLARRCAEQGEVRVQGRTWN